MRPLQGRAIASMAALGMIGLSAGVAQAASLPAAPAPSPGTPGVSPGTPMASPGTPMESPGTPGASPGAQRPTIVLVHGAWADTSSWNGEVALLRQAGYDARAIANPLRNLTSDAATVADFLKTLPGPIVLVGHSYGGSVITNAAAGVPNVKALVFVDAAAPDVGETTAALSGKNSALSADPASLFDKVPYPGAPQGATDLYLKQNVFIQSFANDLPPQVAARLWATQRAASTSALMSPSAAAAWKTIPSWYFISTGDKIITATSEMSMAQRAHSKIVRFAGGSHLTLISHPDAVTTVIKAALKSVQSPSPAPS